MVAADAASGGVAEAASSKGSTVSLSKSAANSQQGHSSKQVEAQRHAETKAYQEDARRMEAKRKATSRTASKVPNQAIEDDAESASKSSDSEPSTVNIPKPSGGTVASDGAGIILGFLIWVWVVLPFFNGKGARNVLRAKFTNKGPDGKVLP